MKSLALVAGLVLAAQTAYATDYYYCKESNEALVVNGTNAEIVSLCGSTVYTNWSTDGKTMTGAECGGPVCEAPTAIKGQAEVSGQDIIVTEGKVKWTFVPTATQEVAQICL